MSLKELIRPLPGVRRLSLLRQRASFAGSTLYWERSYARGRTSGPGSYGDLARSKSEFLNAFVRRSNISSVIELGCGDGNQLSLARYPSYVGMDVSPTVLKKCIRRFADDETKSFFLYDSLCFSDRRGIFEADASLSLDVIYHLVEDAVFSAYMDHLFGVSRQYVVIYSTNVEIRGTAPHVRHREFSAWVSAHKPTWHLIREAPGLVEGPRAARFYVYEKGANKSV